MQDQCTNCGGFKVARTTRKTASSWIDPGTRTVLDPQSKVNYPGGKRFAYGMLFGIPAVIGITVFAATGIVELAIGAGIIGGFTLSMLLLAGIGSVVIRRYQRETGYVRTPGTQATYSCLICGLEWTWAGLGSPPPQIASHPNPELMHKGNALLEEEKRKFDAVVLWNLQQQQKGDGA